MKGNFKEGKGKGNRNEDTVVVSVPQNETYGNVQEIYFCNHELYLCFGSCDLSKRKLLPEDSSLVTCEEAAREDSSVFLYIPVKSYEQLLPDLKSLLANNVLVDFSNPNTSSQPRCNFVSRSTPCKSFKVKALNTFSAWALENKVFGEGQKTYICGHNQDSRFKIRQLWQEAGFRGVDNGKLTSTANVERKNLKPFSELEYAFVVTKIVTCIFLIYYGLRIFASEKKGSKRPNQSFLYHESRISACISLCMYSLVYLPECLVGFIQIFRDTMHLPLPKWLDKWIKSRKHIGIFALFFACIHGVLGVIVLDTEQVKSLCLHLIFPKMKEAAFSHFTFNGKVFSLFGILALALFSFLGIYSFPIKDARVSLKRWNFVESKLGYVGLMLATLHVLIYDHNVYNRNIPSEFWTWNMPPLFFLVSIFAALVLLIKVILLFFELAYFLCRIRCGCKRNEAGTKEIFGI